MPSRYGFWPITIAMALAVGSLLIGEIPAPAMTPSAVNLVASTFAMPSRGSVCGNPAVTYSITPAAAREVYQRVAHIGIHSVQAH